MMLRHLITLLSMLVLLAACTEPKWEDSSHDSTVGDSESSTTAAELIPFSTLFTPDSYRAPQVSPDGRWLSWIAPAAGINNFFVAPVDDLSAIRQLTFKQKRGVRPADVSGVVMYKWSSDSRYLLYPHDYAGDENWDIWLIDVVAAQERNLTPSPDKSWQILGISPNRPDVIVASANTFGKRDSVLYRLNLKSAKTEQLFSSNGEFYTVIPGHDYQPLVGVVITPESTLNLYRNTDTGWELMVNVLQEDMGALTAANYQKIFRVSSDNRYLYTYSSAGRNTNALVSYDLRRGDMRVIAEDERVDLGGVHYHPVTNKPLAYAANWDRLSWTTLDNSVAADLATVASLYPDGDFTIVSQSNDQNLWVLKFLFPNAPISYYLWNRDQQQLTDLGVTSPELLDMELSRMFPTIMDSSDGLPLISYYSLPPGSDADGDTIPDHPLPTIMLVHGGPSDERAVYAFGSMIQWLNSRGYAVYAMNYRGSAGFGKAYLNASHGEWGGKMHRDLLEQLQYVVDKGITDPDKVAIIGGSYGGYATLVGMTMTPDVFACGVDLVGPSNLEIPMPHWAPSAMAVFLGGDPRTEEGRAFLRSISPVSHAHKTRGAVLIGQGANDSRVPQDQSDQIVEIMDKAGAKVVYAVYDDEGHGFQRSQNNWSFWAVAEIFLGQCLGGPYEPLGDKLQGSSIRVPIGAEHVPGLPQALAELESTRQ